MYMYMNHTTVVRILTWISNSILIHNTVRNIDGGWERHRKENLGFVDPGIEEAPNLHKIAEQFF